MCAVIVVSLAAQGLWDTMCSHIRGLDRGDAGRCGSGHSRGYQVAVPPVETAGGWVQAGEFRLY